MHTKSLSTAKFLSFVIVLLSALLLSTSAAAAQTNVSWAAQPDWTYASANSAATIATAFYNPNACKGDGRIYVRTRTVTKSWTRAKAVSGCQKLRQVSTPSVSIDKRTKSVIVVWSQVTIIGSKKANGVFMMVGKSYGKKFGKPILLQKTPAALSPVIVASGSNRGIVWVANTSKQSLRSIFTVSGYSIKSGKRTTKNVATKRGTYYVNDNAAMFKVDATNQGLFVSWELTDAGGSRAFNMARAAWRGSSAKPLAIAVTPPSGTSTFAATSAAGDEFVATETLVTSSDPVSRNYSFYKYNISTKVFEAVANFSVPANIISPTQMLTFGVDSANDLYAAYEVGHPAVSPTCFVIQIASGCVRNTAPSQSSASIEIRKIPLGSPTTQFVAPQILWPFTPTQSAGDSIVEWLMPRKGAETMAFGSGAVSINSLQGFENVTTSGSVGVRPKFRVVTHSIPSSQFTLPVSASLTSE